MIERKRCVKGCGKTVYAADLCWRHFQESVKGKTADEIAKLVREAAK